MTLNTKKCCPRPTPNPICETGYGFSKTEYEFLLRDMSRALTQTVDEFLPRDRLRVPNPNPIYLPRERERFVLLPRERESASEREKQKVCVCV